MRSAPTIGSKPRGCNSPASLETTIVAGADPLSACFGRPANPPTVNFRAQRSLKLPRVAPEKDSCRSLILEI